MECTLRNKEEMLQGPCVTVNQLGTKQFRWKTECKKNRKNVWQSTQRNYENGSTVTQKEVTKWSVHLETMEKRYKDLL